ncbi:MAG: hypothetical protein ACUVRN_04610 [Candidatus Caldatribacteriaceae bacterium]
MLACDSLGSIGPKEGDRVKVPLWVSSRFTARVALAELFSVGADPVAAVVTLSMEPYPFLEEVKEGIREELKVIGKGEIPILCSSEKNVRSFQTGLGITMVGKRVATLPLPTFPLFLYALGIPSCGEEVLLREKYIADLNDLLWLRTITPFILPVGSQGIIWEALTFLRDVSAKLCLESSLPYSIFQSCGPATVFLFASPKGFLGTFYPKPIWKVGTLFSI